MGLEEIGKNDLAEAFYGWFTEVLTMSEAINERIDPKLPALERLKLMKGAVVDWDDPECAERWVEEGRAEGFKKGFEKGFKKGFKKGIKEGRAEVSAEVLGMIRKHLYRQTGEGFDPETVGRLTKHLDRISDPERLWEIAEQIHEGATGATLLERLENRS